MECGYATTEFWLNFAIVLLTFLLVMSEKIDSEVWITVGVQGIGYAAARAYRKAKAQPALPDA